MKDLPDLKDLTMHDAKPIRISDIRFVAKSNTLKRLEDVSLCAETRIWP